MPGFNILTVTQITTYLKSYIDENKKFSGIYIRGEIDDFKENIYSGHMYFSLKDAESEIACVMFRNYAERIRFAPKNGMSVIIRGDLSVYKKSCSCQLYVYDIQPEGLGAKYLAFEQLKERLEKEGLFALEAKKALPRFPDKIGVITSAQGAAVHDIINVTARRWPMAKLILTPVSVQGADASDQLIRALKKQDNDIKPDVIIIGRGGGSSDDLSAFNDEELARTVFSCKTPVISAVGHETDFSICDFVADLRAPTPSAAAELASPDCCEIEQTLDANLEFLESILRKKISTLSAKLSVTSPVKAYNFTEKTDIRFTSRLNEFDRMIKHSLKNKIESESFALKTELAKLDSNNPAKILKRTFCRAEKDGKNIKSINDISIGESFDLYLYDGHLKASVNEKAEGGLSF